MEIIPSQTHPAKSGRNQYESPNIASSSLQRYAVLVRSCEVVVVYVMLYNTVYRSTSEPGTERFTESLLGYDQLSGM